MKKRKRGKLSKNPYSKKELIDVVLSFFRESPHKNFNYKQIYKLLGTKNPEIKTLIVGVLLGLYKNGSLLEIKPGKYKLSEHSHKKKGIIKTVSFRGLLVETEDKEEVLQIEISLYDLKLKRKQMNFLQDRDDFKLL